MGENGDDGSIVLIFDCKIALAVSDGVEIPEIFEVS